MPSARPRSSSAISTGSIRRAASGSVHTSSRSHRPRVSNASHAGADQQLTTTRPPSQGWFQPPPRRPRGWRSNPRLSPRAAHFVSRDSDFKKHVRLRLLRRRPRRRRAPRRPAPPARRASSWLGEGVRFRGPRVSLRGRPPPRSAPPSPRPPPRRPRHHRRLCGRRRAGASSRTPRPAPPPRRPPIVAPKMLLSAADRPRLDPSARSALRSRSPRVPPFPCILPRFPSDTPART